MDRNFLISHFTCGLRSDYHSCVSMKPLPQDILQVEASLPRQCMWHRLIPGDAIVVTVSGKKEELSLKKKNKKDMVLPYTIRIPRSSSTARSFANQIPGSSLPIRKKKSVYLENRMHIRKNTGARKGASLRVHRGTIV